MDQPKHIPVLLEEVLKLLNPKQGDHYLDLTAGWGGHASKIIELVGAEGSSYLVDRDENSVEHLKKTFPASNVNVIRGDFLSASKALAAEGKKFDVILADLGLSSPHVDDASRGFSFAKSGPLDMRMDARQTRTAADIVNDASEEELARILYEYGELKRARKLTKKIVQHRPYTLTTELAEVIAEATPKRGRIHPATQVFQALRIAVNDELKQLEDSLPLWVSMLNAGGRLGVISFHSLEDRLVKRAFKNYGGKRYDASLQTVTKKPVVPSEQEIVFNPRARSAKLRVAQRK
jgi:16S rRNA (cytosine1402-N4)-methyltransferase